ncbi:unnamed protein product [Onchocerca flexuosa]|uniref:Uncharacterized protein n=1 Tax=Onchocerca flexuosa TaxID=387005 RepID=A0A183H0V4_9BILA|nr:unnamed protein product [Onchocerca flexuosa]
MVIVTMMMMTMMTMMMMMMTTMMMMAMMMTMMMMEIWKIVMEMKFSWGSQIFRSFIHKPIFKFLEFFD